MNSKNSTPASSDDRISEALRQLGDQAAPPRIMQRAMQQIAAEQKLARHKAVNIGFSMAFAASLFAALLVPGLFGTNGNDNTDSVLSSITMSMNDQRTVNIVFDSPEAVAEATITVSLPDNLRIAGYESLPVLKWNTPLRAGKNTLSIPLVARNSGEGIVHSQLEINGQAKTFTLLVDVANESAPSSAIQTTHT